MKWYETTEGKEWLDSQSDLEQLYKDQQSRSFTVTVVLNLEEFRDSISEHTAKAITEYLNKNWRKE